MIVHDAFSSRRWVRCASDHPGGHTLLSLFFHSSLTSSTSSDGGRLAVLALLSAYHPPPHVTTHRLHRWLKSRVSGNSQLYMRSVRSDGGRLVRPASNASVLLQSSDSSADRCTKLASCVTSMHSDTFSTRSVGGRCAMTASVTP